MIKPIRSEEDLRSALDELYELVQTAQPGTPEGDRLEVLGLLIHDYEAKHHPILPPDPIDAIEFALERKGLTRKALEPLLGARSRVSEVLNRKRTLTLSQIRALSAALEIPADILIAPYERRATPATRRRIQATKKKPAARRRVAA